MKPRPPRLSTEELRMLWRAHTDPSVRAAIIELNELRAELQRSSEVIRQIAQLHEIIRTTWREEVGGQLVALEHLKALVNDELAHAGRLPSEW